MAETLFEGELFADYFQLLIGRPEVLPQAIPTDWNDDSLADRLVCFPGGAVATTERNMSVPVRVSLHADRPDGEDAADHVVSGWIETGGILLVAGLMDDLAKTPRLAVPPGGLGVRVSSHGLDTLSVDGLDGDDRYAIALWPAPEFPLSVERRFPLR